MQIFVKWESIFFELFNYEGSEAFNPVTLRGVLCLPWRLVGCQLLYLNEYRGLIWYANQFVLLLKSFKNFRNHDSQGIPVNPVIGIYTTDIQNGLIITTWLIASIIKCAVKLIIHSLTGIPAWIINYMYSKMWDDITYPFQNFNGITIEVWEWISDFSPRFPGMWLLIHVWIDMSVKGTLNVKKIPPISYFAAVQNLIASRY